MNDDEKKDQWQSSCVVPRSFFCACGHRKTERKYCRDAGALYMRIIKISIEKAKYSITVIMTEIAKKWWTSMGERIWIRECKSGNMRDKLVAFSLQITELKK
ncbi:hypothetical protein [Massilicoli timonensis]|uniref:hypothetical protein n=1 Tax=Massilicoli timonensis TaxID=2015901 RepID=UPI0011AF3B07|nr:hypothetical protein [Massilicoli timonensis]